MFSISYKNLFFKKMVVWFADRPYEVEKVHVLQFLATKQKYPIKSFQMKEAPTLVIDLSNDLDAIWSKMGNRSCRYLIRRGEKAGIKIQRDFDLNYFLESYKSFTKEKGFAPSFKNPKEIPKANVILSAYLGEKILSSSLFIYDDQIFRWLITWSVRMKAEKDLEFFIGCANRMLIWESIKYAKEKGLRIFDLGGISNINTPTSPLYGIDSFKRIFGGKETVYWNYIKYYSKSYKVLKQVHNILKEKFKSLSFFTNTV